MATLYLIPTTLSNEISTNALLPEALLSIKHLRHFIVETAKTGRMHLKHLNLDTKLQELDIQELNKHTTDIDDLICPLKEGFDMGLISDCGLPAIADPGHQVVRIAHANNFKVKPLSGPSSLMLALMASGVNGQSFAFNGYLPIDNIQKIEKIKQLQKLILEHNQTQIIIETPFRNQQLLEILIKTLNHDITLAIAMNLMADNEMILSKPVSKWLKSELPEVHKQEVVFIIGIAL